MIRGLETGQLKTTAGSVGLLILGGGPAGLGTAFYAHRHHLAFQLFEKAPTLGGLCRTFQFGKHRYDSGAHRFHDLDPEVTADLKDLLGSELREVNSASKVFVAGRFLDFPPTPFNLLRSARPALLRAMALDFLRARRTRRPVVSFADYAISQFGKTLAEQFLLNYTAKVWGLPAEQLSPAVATRRLSGMTLRSLFNELIFPSRRVRHIDGAFLYPRGGYGTIVEKLAACLPIDAVHTGSEVTAIEHEGGCVRRIHFREQILPVGPGDRVVSTLPLTLLVELLSPGLGPEVEACARLLRFRHIRLIYLRLDQARFSANASIYIPDPALCISRLSEPKNRSESMAPEDETGLIVEVPCFAGDPVQRLDDQALYRRVIGELEQIGLLEGRRVIDWKHHFLPHAYPVYSLDYAPRVETILQALQNFQNLHVLGRNGLFFYSHLQHQLRFGRDFIEQYRKQGWPERRAVPP